MSKKLSQIYDIIYQTLINHWKYVNRFTILRPLFTYVRLQAHILDGHYHVEASFHAAHGMIRSCLPVVTFELRHTVIAITEQLYTQTMIVLWEQNVEKIVKNLKVHLPLQCDRNEQKDRLKFSPIVGPMFC